jgi:hypothetical protein
MHMLSVRKAAIAQVGMLGLLLAAPAAAQGNIKHDGLYFGVGLGIGWAKYNGDATDGTTESGPSGTLRLGGHVKPNLLIGGETNGWYKSQDGATYTWGSLMATTYWYPGKSLPLFVKGGLGWMHTSISDDFDDLSSSHFAFQVGTGYDLKIAKGSAITFYGNWIKGLSGSLKFDGDDIADVSPSIIQLGAAFSLY